MTASFVGLLAELTHRCPLSCPYCSNPKRLVRRRNELSTERWADVFRQAAAAGALHVHLSGGEPAARRDLVALTAHAHDVGLYTNLITSGIGLTPERLRALTAAGLDHLQLSVQSTDADRAASIGGREGALTEKRRVAQEAAALGIPLTLNVVLHRGNLDEVDALVALAVKWGARRLELAHVQLMGFAWHNREALVASDDAMRAAQPSLARALRAPPPGLTIEHVAADTHAGRPKACMGGWGAHFLVVTPDGRILPCHGAEVLPLSFPRATELSLSAAWRSEPFARWRTPRAPNDTCGACPELAHDAGGCRCQAYLASGDVRAIDPTCDRSPLHGAVVELRAKGPRRAPEPRRARPSEPTS